MAVVEGSNPMQLADFIRSLQDFAILPQADGSYDHIGATLADAVLQANNNYDRNVSPRIKRIREEYASETTLLALKQLLKNTSTQQFLNWKGTRKSETFEALVDLLGREGVNTEGDLRTWLQRDDSKAKLLTIRFIGPKTADYLKILVGLQTAAVDVHVFNFIERAGLRTSNYERALKLIHETADLMRVDRSSLDYSIWRYMSRRVADGSAAENHCGPKI